MKMMMMSKSKPKTAAKKMAEKNCVMPVKKLANAGRGTESHKNLVKKERRNFFQCLGQAMKPNMFVKNVGNKGCMKLVHAEWVGLLRLLSLEIICPSP